MTLRQIKEDIPKRPKYQLLGYVSILVLIVLLFIVGTGAFNFQKQNMLEQTKINQNTDEYFTYITSIISENQDKANIQASYLRDQIQNDILTSYNGNTEELKNDIDNPTNNSKLSKIFYNNLNGKYLNMNNDNNDLFVVSLHGSSSGINYDKSINCSKDSGIRVWQVEKTMHYNKDLFEDAKNRIMTQNTYVKNGEFIAWEFLKSSNPNHYIIKQFSTSELKKVFESEGLKGIQTYEALSPAYIKADGKDIFGDDDISNIGEKNNNYKLAIVQGFNIVDAINSNLKDLAKVQEYENKLTQIKEESIHNKEIILFETFSLSIIMLLLIISIISLQSKFFDEERGEENLIESNHKE